MANTVEQELARYFTQMSDEEKQGVLQMIKAFLKRQSNTAERISIQQYNEELRMSEAQIEAGQFTTQEDLEKEMKNW